MRMSRQTDIQNCDTSQTSKGWLINRNFALLSVGQAISNIGDFVYSTTLLIWVYALGGSVAAVSGVLVAYSLPIFVLGPIAGVFVDRWQRLRTMQISDLARALLALLPLCVPEPLRLPATYISVFLISGISRFFMPARSAVTQVIVSEQQQAQAASIGQVIVALSIIIGPALASPLYFAVGPVIAILLNSASYLVSAFCLWRMRVPLADLLPTTNAAEPGRAGGIRAVGRELATGFGFALKTRVLLVVVILLLVAMLGGGLINTLDIVFVSQRLHANTGLYGIISAVSGVGMLIGAIFAGLLAKRIEARRMLAGSLILLGISLSIYALQTRFALALLFSFCLGVPQGGLNVGVAPLLMRATPRHLMGRVQAVSNTAAYGANLLASGLAGYLGLFVPAYLLFLGGAILVVLAGVFGWFALPGEPAPLSLDDVPERMPALANE
jgi:MFS family permease